MKLISFSCSNSVLKESNVFLIRIFFIASSEFEFQSGTLY